MCFVSVFAADKPPVSKGVKNATADVFDKLRSEKNTVILGVRAEKEFKDGRIPGTFDLDVDGPDFAKKVAALDKEKIYLVRCASGTRSLKACSVMKEDGFNSWAKACKPV